VACSLDLFVLMCYDMTSDDAAGDMAGPNSRLDDILNGAKRYTQLGISASKLMLILGWCECDRRCIAPLHLLPTYIHSARYM
jgi:hypothetical protein